MHATYVASIYSTYGIRSKVCVHNADDRCMHAGQELVDDTIGFQKWTEPMQNLLLNFLSSESPTYCVSSAHPRIVDGAPTKNPRYLQVHTNAYIHTSFVRQI
jgi:hypothetical protein